MVRCKARTNNGTRCTRDAERGSQYCGQHQSSRPSGSINIELANKLPSIGIIQGPSIITEMYNNSLGIHVYLIGEKHYYYGDCYHPNKGVSQIQDWLYDSFKASEKHIDFFVEVPYIKQSYERREDTNHYINILFISYS